MRKLISTLLIFTTLFANLSWAADMHAETHASNWPDTLSICAADWPQDDDGAATNHSGSDTCDHCCHGFAHIVGFAPQHALVFPAAADTATTLAASLFRSRSQLPPIPPPDA